MVLSDVKEQVKRAADIVEVVGQYVQLSKRGRNYIGLCPFHSEKTPSFTVNPEKQIYHCFGCGKGGDVFSFWMEYHNLSFFQSLKDIAERYNIDLPGTGDYTEDKRKAELKELLFKVNAVAAEYYHNVLVKSAQGGGAREYLSARKLAGETISEYTLGYAPGSGDGLRKYLESKEISLDTGEKAGLLVSRKDGSFYDRFRDRIIFPIFDLNGQAIGFGGRVLKDSLPKYLNTPETPIYHKGRTLYGLNSAFGPIRKNELAIIVEGYMDMLALRQHGVPNVIATLGTALTEEQVRRLKGYTRNVTVLFDPDDAGQKAALRSFPLFLNEAISAKVLVLPRKEDPDSYVNRYGAESFKKLLEKAVPIFDFYLDRVLKTMEPGVEGKVRVLREVLPVFTALEQGATRSLYVKRFSEKTGIDESVVLDELGILEKKGAKTRENFQPGERLALVQGTEGYSSDRDFLNLLIHYPEKIAEFIDKDWELIISDQMAKEIITELMKRVTNSGELKDIEECTDNPDAKARLRKALMSNIYTKEEAGQAVKELQDKIYRKKLSLSIKKASAEGDLETLNRLIKEKNV